MKQLFRVYDERAVLDKLLKNSHLFRAYWLNVRSKITIPVFWAQASADLLQAAGANAVAQWIDEGTVIHLAALPARLEDAETVAHELTHVLLRQQGYPVAGAAIRNGVVAAQAGATFGGLFQEAMVHEIVQSCGFNPLASREWLHPDYWRKAAQTDEAPADRKTCILKAVHLVHIALIYQRLTGIARLGGALNEYARAVPAVGKDAQRILQKIENHGWQTPLQQRHLFRWLITEYNLYQDIEVKE